MRVSGQGRQAGLLAFAMLWAAQAAGQEFIISTVAGGAPPPNPAVATSVAIGAPVGVAADASGNVYLLSSNYCVFKRDTAGVLTRIAGNSRPGFSGDGGPAADAQLHFAPISGVAVDAAGYVYIADTYNQRVRRVSPSGIITTVAGTGGQGFSGDGGPATSARLWNPTGVAVDGAGNLYIADAANDRIRRVSPAGTITTVPGTQGPFGPRDTLCVAVDAAGNVYISDYSTVRRVATTGAVTTFGDDLFNPSGIAVDNAGNLYIADTNHFRVRRHPTALVVGGIYTVAGTGDGGFSGDGGPATSAQLGYPVGLATDPAGNLYIADRNNYRIRRVTPPGAFFGGIISTIAGNGIAQFSGDGGPATSAQIDATDVIPDGAGGCFIAEPANHRVRHVSSAGIITTFAGTGQAGFSGDGGSATSAQFDRPAGVTLDAAGYLYIADSGNHRVRSVSPAGIIGTAVGNGTAGFSGDGGPAAAAQLSTPYGLAFDTAGNLYVADATGQRIRRVSSSGIITTVAGNGRQGYSGDGGPATSAELNIPTAVVADAAGNLYIADTWNRRVRRVSPSGIITTVAGTGENGYSGDGGPASAAKLGVVDGITLDPAGNLYIADRENRVRRVSPAGIITTVAGTGVEGYSGDGGPATSAQLAFLDRLAADAAGRIYVSTNTAIRLLTPTCTASASPAALAAPAAGGALTLTIQAETGCPWTIAGLPAWITASTTSGSGAATVVLIVAANAGPARSQTITAAGTAVTVSQAGGGTCTYSISPVAQRFPAAGGTGTIAVTTAAGCPWTAAASTSFIVVTAGRSGSGSGTVTFEVLPTDAALLRTGSILVAGIRFNLEQLGQWAQQPVPAGSMPQVASGGGWKTIFTLVNNGSAPAVARLTFTADSGGPLALPLAFPQTGTVAPAASSVERTLSAGAVLIVEAEGPVSQPVQQGWAQLFTDGAVTGFAVFCLRLGESEYEAVVPLETRTTMGYLLPFDNIGLETGVAVSNLAPEHSALTVIINDDRGARIQTATLNLPPSGHTAFALSTQYPATAGRRGTIEFRRPAIGGEIGVLGLRFNPKGAFTTVPVTSK